MSTLRKRKNKKYFHIRFTKMIHGKRFDKEYSLKIRYKIPARILKDKIDIYIENNRINPFDEYFDFEQIVNEVEGTKLIFCEEALKEFLEDKSHRSKGTRDAYENNIGYFLRYCNLRNSSVSVLNEKIFKKFLRRDGVKPVTLDTNKRHLKVWWNWMIKNKMVDDFDPISDIELPYVSVQYREKMLSEMELLVIFKKFDEIIEENRKRKNWRIEYEKPWFKPAIAIFFYAGCRLNEVGYDPKKPTSGLRAQNITDDRSFIYLFKAKRDRERYIPIANKLHAYLDPYLDGRGDISGDDFVFVNRKGFPITGRTIREVFNSILRNTEVPDTRTIHGMRHNRITEWIEMGMSLSETSNMGGHYSTRMTDEKYTHLAHNRLLEKYRRLEGAADKNNETTNSK